MKPSRLLARIAVVSVAVLALSGCIKLDMNLDVQADNTVDGTMVFAVSKQLTELPGFNSDDLSGPLESPAAGKVTSKPYDDGTWVGTEVQYRDVPLADFGGSESGDDLTITRVGDQFKVSGTLDMSGDATATPTEGFDPAALGGSAEIRIRLTFPGEVVSANGTVDGNSVTWTPKFGETLDVAAVANAEPSGSSTTWLIVGGLLVGLLVVGGFLVATMRRRESAAPVPPGSVVPGAELVGASLPAGPVAPGTGDAVDGAPGRGCRSAAAPGVAGGSLRQVRLTEFWRRMADQLGPSYAETWARYTVLAELGGRTVDQALADGEPAKDVWRAVHAHLDLPPALR